MRKSQERELLNKLLEKLSREPAHVDWQNALEEAPNASCRDKLAFLAKTALLTKKSCESRVKERMLERKWSQLQKTMQEEKDNSNVRATAPSPRRPILLWRNTTTSLAAAAASLLIATTGVTSLAWGSLPDSKLYPVKKAVERAWSTAVRSPLGMAGYELDLAEKRLEEATVLGERETDRYIPGLLIEARSHLEKSNTIAMGLASLDADRLLQRSDMVKKCVDQVEHSLNSGAGAHTETSAAETAGNASAGGAGDGGLDRCEYGQIKPKDGAAIKKPNDAPATSDGTQDDASEKATEKSSQKNHRPGRGESGDEPDEEHSGPDSSGEAHKQSKDSDSSADEDDESKDMTDEEEEDKEKHDN